MIELNNENFEQEVLKSDKLVLVDFWANGCGPCRMIGSILDKLSRDDVTICKANIDDAKDYAIKYSIDSVPSLLFFKQGEVVDRLVGMQSKSNIEKKIEGLK